MARDRSEGGAIPGRGLGSLLDAAEAGARGRRCETVIASSGEAIWSGALDGTIESWNPAAERLYGYREEEIVGRSAAILRPARDLDAFTREQSAVAGGDPMSLDTSGRRKDGTLVDVAITQSPLCDEEGTVVGVVSVVRDVGEHILTNARLAEAHSRFAGAFDAASTGMAIVASDGRFLAVNAALCRLLARDADTLLGGSLATVTHPEDLVASRERSGRAFNGEVDSCQHSQRFLLPDGGIVWGLLTMTIVRDATVCCCISSRRSRTSATERRLRASCAGTRRSWGRSPSRIR